MLAAKTMPIDFPVGPGTSQSLRCIQGSILEEFGGGASRYLTFVIFVLPQLLTMLGRRSLTPLAVPLGVGKVPGAAKSVRNDFSDNCATSESLCYAQGSIPEQFGCGASRYLTFVIFGPPSDPGCTAKGAWDCLLSIAGGGEGARSREKRAK